MIYTVKNQAAVWHWQPKVVKIRVLPLTYQTLKLIITRGVPNSGFRLFGRIRIRIRIALATEHFDAAPAVLIFTTSLCPSLITAVPACCLAKTLSPSFVSHNQAVWARAAGTDWVKSVVDVTIYSCTIQTKYSYSFWRHYSSEYEYTIRTTIRQHQSECEANIRDIPNPNPSPNKPTNSLLSTEIYSQIWAPWKSKW